MQECVPYELHKTKEINTTEGVYDECQVDPAIANTDAIYEVQPEKQTEPLIFNIAASIIRIIELDKFATKNETPTVRGLAADNNNMQSVLMENMETI